MSRVVPVTRDLQQAQSTRPDLWPSFEAPPEVFLVEDLDDDHDDADGDLDSLLGRLQPGGLLEPSL